jgi:subtilisin family serine protease
LFELNEQINVKIARENDLGYIDLSLPEGSDFREIHDYYYKTGLFESVEINSYGSTFSDPDDPGYSNQYYLQNEDNFPSIDFPFVYGLEDGSSNPIIVAVVDLGVNYNHSDINMNTNIGYDFIDDDAYPLPDDGSSHGISVAGIIGAITNNNNGIAGLAGGNNSTRGAKIMSLRIGWQYEAQNFGLRDSIIGAVVDDAILWAANNGARVINMSFGCSENSAINSAISYAYNQKGCVLVAASGNGNQSTVNYPSSNPYVIAVGGILKNWGNYGDHGTGLDLVAPVEDIYSLLNEGTDYVSGTSFAAPQVAATAALLWSLNPNFLNLDIKNLIKRTASDGDDYLNYDELHDGSGILWAAYAVDVAPYASGPQNVSITAVSGTHPVISWSSVSGATYYKIYRANSAGGPYSFALAGTTTGTSWTDNTYTAVAPRFALSTNYYRVTYVDSDGESITSSQVNCGVNATNKLAASNPISEELKYELYDSYPNPFNPATTITYTIKEKGIVNIEVFDIIGRKIAVLVNDIKEAGSYRAIFDASELASGIYICTIKSGPFTDSKKMILAK